LEGLSTHGWIGYPKLNYTWKWVIVWGYIQYVRMYFFGFILTRHCYTILKEKDKNFKRKKENKDLVCGARFSVVPS
jgi:hypothetical protein